MPIIGKIFLWIIILATVVAMVALAFLNVSGTAIASLMPIVVVFVILAHHDKFSLIKFGNVELRKVISEAKDTIEEIKEFAVVMAKASLSNTARSGWLGGMGIEQRLAILEETRKALKGLGVEESEIKKAEQDYHNCILAEYKIRLTGGHRVPHDKEQECRPEWNKIREGAEHNPVPPKEIKAFLEKYNFLNEDLKKRLSDYEYYWNNLEFKDFEDFKNRENWPKGLKSV